ncbi:MAG: hypothetical protein ACR2G2_00215 [Pseudonocardia sp.]
MSTGQPYDQAVGYAYQPGARIDLYATTPGAENWTRRYCRSR